MHASTRRPVLVLFLIGAAWVASAALGRSTGTPPPVPAVETLIAGTGWRVQAAAPLAGTDLVYRQWVLRDAAGRQALLYVGATGRAQSMTRWSGELGYEGEGYAVTRREDRALRPPAGGSLTVASVALRGASGRRLVEYAVAGPDGLVAPGGGALLAMARDAVSGRAGRYYPVRVAVPADGDQALAAGSADQLLEAVLPRVLATATG